MIFLTVSLSLKYFKNIEKKKFPFKNLKKKFFPFRNRKETRKVKEKKLYIV